MFQDQVGNKPEIILIVAGAKGAVASTVAAAVASLRVEPSKVLPWLTTAETFGDVNMRMTGWDPSPRTLTESIEDHGVLPDGIWRPCEDELRRMEILPAPPSGLNLKKYINNISHDMEYITKKNANAVPIFVNLLPAAASHGLERCETLDELYVAQDINPLIDIAYVGASIQNGISIVNFSPNEVELAPVVHEAVAAGVPMCGRDGKTGQTYLKVVIASALKARGLYIDGWYSTNILGNADGANLADPEKSKGKLENKTKLLEDLLGYQVGERYGKPSHSVRIDYYPPRGDAKEAWDVIDFLGLFGLRMSLRLNLQGRDSILAAPMVLDLARWMAVLKKAGKSGLVSELGFYFKRPLGESPSRSFQDQIKDLAGLERFCKERLKSQDEE